MSGISGLTAGYPLLGWSLVAGVLAIAGMPPFGLFMSEFLVLSSTFARQPLLAIPLVIGLLVAFGALIWRLHQMAFGQPGPEQKSGPAPAGYKLLAIFAHLGLVFVAGFYLPPSVTAWFRHVAALLG
jgi:hydrogenase-4 component F